MYWSKENRAKSLIGRSSVVTQSLRQNESKIGTEAYERLQSLESKAVAAGAAVEVARGALQASQVMRDEAETDLSALNSACLIICKVRGVTATLFEELDRGDPIGLATHLEEPISRVDTIGPNLAEMLRHQKKLVAKYASATEPEMSKAARAQEELSAALFQLEAGIATARALLASRGVNVKFPMKSAKKTKPGTVGANPDSERKVETTPVAPSNGSTSHAQPAAEFVIVEDAVS